MEFHVKVGFSVILFPFTILVAKGQNDFFFSHYMLNPSYYNPAWIGMGGEAFVSFQHRSQWLGYSVSNGDPGAGPSSQLLSVVVPVQGDVAGLGLHVGNDKITTLNNVQIRASIAFKKEVSAGQIALGIMPGLYMQSLEFSLFRPVEPEQGFPEGKETQMKPDLNAGIWFASNSNYFIGASALNILEPGFDYGTNVSGSPNLQNRVIRKYIVTGGVSFSVTHSVNIRPSILLRTDIKSYSFELSTIVIFKEKMWGGLSFRKSESLTLLIGYRFLEEGKLRFGYSFDYVIENRASKSATSHEVYLQYSLPDVIFGIKKAVKTPRFIF